MVGSGLGVKSKVTMKVNMGVKVSGWVGVEVTRLGGVGLGAGWRLFVCLFFCVLIPCVTSVYFLLLLKAHVVLSFDLLFFAAEEYTLCVIYNVWRCLLLVYSLDVLVGVFVEEAALTTFLVASFMPAKPMGGVAA